MVINSDKDNPMKSEKMSAVAVKPESTSKPKEMDCEIWNDCCVVQLLLPCNSSENCSKFSLP